MKKIVVIVIFIIFVMVTDTFGQAVQKIPFEYKVERNSNGNYAILTKYTGNDSFVVIPMEINGIPITVIGEGCFNYNSSIKTLVLSDNITHLERVEYCENLSTIHISKSVQSIDCNFWICLNLTYFSVDTNNISFKSIDGVLFNKDNTVLIRYPPDKSGTSYTIPNGVKTIGEFAFLHCKNLISIFIPNSVTIIKVGAFYNSFSITSLTIPSSVTVIEHDVFINSALKTINLSEGLISIGKGVFASTNLSSINIPKTVKSIGRCAFDRCNLPESTRSELISRFGKEIFDHYDWDGL
jgi:hypothetical protein